MMKSPIMQTVALRMMKAPRFLVLSEPYATQKV